jgi:hypothetical protein
VGQHQVSVAVSDGHLDAQCVSQLDVLDCEKPSLTCPAAFSAECTAAGSATVTPPPASATDNCGVTIQPPSAGSFPLGTSTLTYRATDPSSNTSTCTTAVTVQDTRPRPSPIVAECQLLSRAFVVPGHATSSDVCTSATVTGPAPGLFPFGTNVVTYTSTDQSGNQARCNSTIQVVDTTPPLALATRIVTLSPPDHQYRTVNLTDCNIVVVDACGGLLEPSVYQPRITCVTSDEPDDAPGNGDGNTTNDIVLVDQDTVKLRSERDVNRNGRRYKIHFQVRDGSGNRADSVCSVIVPRNNQCVADPTLEGCVVEGDSRNSVCAP